MQCLEKTCKVPPPPVDDRNVFERVQDAIADFFVDYVIKYWAWSIIIGTLALSIIFLLSALCCRCCCFRNFRVKGSDFYEEDSNIIKQRRQAVR